jgi:hypothetical protein
VVGLLAACVGQPAVVAPVVVRPIDEVIAHTVLLSEPGCTGVRVGGGLVLTAKHCIEDRYDLNDTYSGFQISHISATRDFIVMAGDTFIKPVALSSALIGEHVYIVGFPMSIDDGAQALTVTDGVFTGREFEGMERITAYAYYGNSGGGVWNDAGELIGILVEMRPDSAGYHGLPSPHPAYSYMVPVRSIRGAL